MKENKDGIIQLIGLAGSILAISSFFVNLDDIRRLMFLMSGATLLIIAVFLIYTKKVSNLQKGITKLKKNYSNTERLIKLEMEFENFKKNKKGQHTDFEAVLKVGLLFFGIYLIGKMFSWW